MPSGFCHCFRKNILFKIVNLFGIFIFEDGQQPFIAIIKLFLFYVEKKALTDCAEDADCSKLWGSAPLHPVRCPVARGYIVMGRTQTF